MARGWLFTRGPESVRLVRVEQSHGPVQLFVYGPEHDVTKYEFGDVVECMKRQADVKQWLLGAGYQLAGLQSDRRHKGAVWHGPDRRRVAS